jgi:hypothetical protein
MRKYFYLNEDNHWVGPYSFPRIVIDVIRTKIQTHSPLWSKHIGDGNSEHPTECIRERKAAYENPLLPSWLFPANIRTSIKKWKTNLQKRFEKDDGMAKILLKPIEPGKLLDNAPLKFTLASLTAISDFNALGKFETTLIYFTRDHDVVSSLHTAYIKHTKKHGFSFNIIMQPVGADV